MGYLINSDVPIGSAINQLGSLRDVEINNPLGKDVLAYDSTTNTWVNDDTIGNVVSLTQSQYDALSSAEKMDSKKYYYITDATISGAPIDDNDISVNKTWSSGKINSKLGAFGEYVEVSITSGTEIRSSLLSRLIALVDTAKITPRACLQFINSSGQVYTFPLTTIVPGTMYFSAVTGIGTSMTNIVQIAAGTGAYWRQCSIATTTYSATDYITYNDIAGTIMRFYY